MNATDKCCDWVGDTFADRIHKCRAMLAMHGFISPSASEEVKRRQVKRGIVPADAIFVPDGRREGRDG